MGTFSLSRRADLAAARLREQSFSILSQAAQINLKPQLNLTVSTRYTALRLQMSP
jgi:outer membrane protein TolC